jgi:hypothetical protein
VNVGQRLVEGQVSAEAKEVNPEAANKKIETMKVFMLLK